MVRHPKPLPVKMGYFSQKAHFTAPFVVEMK